MVITNGLILIRVSYSTEALKNSFSNKKGNHENHKSRSLPYQLTDEICF